MAASAPMPDFLQTGSIITLPLLFEHTGRLDADLASWSRERPLALLLPCHARDLDNPALTHIIETIAGIPWISYVMIGLDGADEARYNDAARKFKPIGHGHTLVHHDMRRAAPGKGRNIRDTARLLMERRDIFAIAIHDCDILTYSRDFLARLCWPVLHPGTVIKACKGYYARTAGALHGRVFRLLFQPLLRAWRLVFPHQKFPAFLRAFRYPLAGEICLTRELLARQAFDPGWGFEVRMLHSLHLTAPDAICQAELCSAYDHKHQTSGALVLMAEEIISTLRDLLRGEGSSFTSAEGDAVLRACQDNMARALRDSALMAQMHGLPWAEAEEKELASQFMEAVRRGLPGGGREGEITES